jgi:hypothetical protein
METYLAVQPYNGPVTDFSAETLLWVFGLVLVLTVAWILAAKAMEWFRKKHPQREDEVWRCCDDPSACYRTAAGPSSTVQWDASGGPKGRQLVHRACEAMPEGVPTAAVTQASHVPDEHLPRAERMPVRTPAGRLGDPRARRGLN